MSAFHNLNKVAFSIAIVGLAITSCKKKTEEVIKEVVVTETVNTVIPAFRPKIDYSKLKAKTPYDSLFLDEKGVKTVDSVEGHIRIKMFKALNTYIASVTGKGVKSKLDEAKLKNYFYNWGGVFANPELDGATVNLRGATGASRGDAPIIRAYIEKLFTQISVASDSVNSVASSNKAGRITANNGTSIYLLDSNGVESGQLIVKSLIGALQFDYIANVLMSDSKLNADNHTLVSGKNYTELEHNWDLAYSMLTLNQVYAINATDINSGGESFIGSYTREYGNSAYGNDYLKIHPAFLRGRAAIVNNDIAEVKAQATIIKGIFEKVIARASVGYLKKWKDNVSTDPGAAAHAMGEGLGFIYSLRFCKINGGDDAFSDGILYDLVYSKPNGVWDLSSIEATTASNKIIAKFGL